ncbi:MAG: nucleotidyl transferase AbiEii/AbiGii toxin family protein, partial [Muribaculaceae bacterium]|nr:nucleotidyl transferase AbiEii/AbiGii toxin family protein [Muribaculaceae bacterium]
MKLHHDKALFAEIISRASEHPVNGGLGIKPQFIEKDYWITNTLYHLSKSPYKETGIFKGGTSLAKAYSIGYRFSEYIDMAVMRNDVISDAKLKETIRGIEQVMATDITLSGGNTDTSVIPGQILLEINYFANPFPYQQKPIKSFIYDFLTAYSHRDIIQEYELEP